MDLINKMTSKLIEDTNKKLAELNKMIQNLNDQCSKELKSLKCCQYKTRSRSDQCEDRLSDLKGSAVVGDLQIRDT